MALLEECDPEDRALKSVFLGPQAENGQWFNERVNEVLLNWINWRKSLNPQDGKAISTFDQESAEFKAVQDRIHQALLHLLKGYQNEIPTFSPRYLGHMFSEISLPALLGHWVALVHNPNLVSAESSKVGAGVEKEAIKSLAQMLGWSNGVGHFTSGGTVANFEAVVRAREKFSKIMDWRKGVLFVPRHRHYSWLKAIKVLGFDPIQLQQVKLNAYGRMDVEDLREQMQNRLAQGYYSMMVVSVMGSTECGVFDPVDRVQQVVEVMELKNNSIPIWHHVDAAYGGFFCAVEPTADDLDLKPLLDVISGIKKVNSITLDPHKLAYVPYSCGAFLCRNVSDYALGGADAPYLEFGDTLDPGKYSIEGSRAATGASAVWMISKSIGFNREGLGRVLLRTILHKEDFKWLIRSTIPHTVIVDQAGSNVVGLVMGRPGERMSEVNARMLRVYGKFSYESESSFILSKTELKGEDYSALIERVKESLGLVADDSNLVILRFCLMNPFLKTKEMNASFLNGIVQDLKQAIMGTSINAS